MAVACSSENPGEDGSGDSGAAEGGARNGIVLGSSGQAPTSPPGSGGSSAGPAGGCSDLGFEGCAEVSYEGESVPLDIYVMFDQSGSMLNDVGGMTRLQAVQRATAEFLRAPESAAIGVGIGYFGIQPIGEASCSAAEYERPAVGITDQHESIVSSLESREPTGETPTGAALRGACKYASTWKRENPGRAVVILLVTDGVPEAPVTCGTGGCCPTLDDAVSAAAACAGESPNIPTYVLGVGPALGNLTEIARAGRTDSAYLVEDRNATTDVLRALNAIRGDALIPCELEIPEPPPGSRLDYKRVNLSYSLSGCDYEPLYYVESASGCKEAGGWFYDDPAAPNTVKLCPRSCDLVSRPDAGLRFSLGCETLFPPVR